MQINNYAQLVQYIYNNTAYRSAVDAGRHDAAKAMVQFMLADYNTLRVLQRQWGDYIPPEELGDYLTDDLQHGLQILSLIHI